jgi:hypothetical protein
MSWPAMGSPLTTSAGWSGPEPSALSDIRGPNPPSVRSRTQAPLLSNIARQKAMAAMVSYAIDETMGP